MEVKPLPCLYSFVLAPLPCGKKNCSRPVYDS